MCGHRSVEKIKNLTGTARYASMNTHLGIGMYFFTYTNNEEDIEWLHSEDFQDEMGRKRIQTAKKRNSKIVMENNTESETHKTSPSEENTTTIQKTHSGTCCTLQ